MIQSRTQSKIQSHSRAWADSLESINTVKIMLKYDRRVRKICWPFPQYCTLPNRDHVLSGKSYGTALHTVVSMKVHDCGTEAIESTLCSLQW